MKNVLECVTHTGYGARREVFNIENISNDECKMTVCNKNSSNKIVEFADREKFEQLMRCGYTFVVCYGDIIEYIMK